MLAMFSSFSLFSSQGSTAAIRSPSVFVPSHGSPASCFLLFSGDISVPMVGSSGLEPPTSRLSGVRSNHLSYEPIFVAVCRCFSPLRPTFSQPSSRLHAPSAAGGDEQTRTVDPLLARQVLSHLSYTPIYAGSLSTSLKTPVPFSRNRWNRSRGPSSRGLQN